MPILEQGYEPWKGTIRRDNLRVLHIAREALRRNNRWWVWVLLLASLFFGSIKEYFFVFLVYVPQVIFGAQTSPAPGFMQAFADHPRFYTDMMGTQAFWALVMGITVGTGEIAEDLRTGALTFYLGRPVTRRDYLLGKVVAVSAVVLLVSLVPTLLLFLLQALLEGTWAWISGHARVPAAAAGFAVVLCAFVSAVSLGIAALVRRRLLATVAAAGTLLLLTAVAAVLAPARSMTSEREHHRIARRLEEAPTREERRRILAESADSFDDIGSASEHADWKVIAPLSCLAAVARDCFGNEVPRNFSGGRHWFVILGATGLFHGVLWRRIRAVDVVT